MNTQVCLTLQTSPTLPVEAETLIPENVAGKGPDAINALTILVGNRQERVGDHFSVAMQQNETSGSESDLPQLLLSGDLSRFKRLGERMSAGSMVIEGSVGFNAGAYMRGGSLSIRGNAGDYLGAHMQGGSIEVRGSAGHFVGAAYRGFAQGMTGGAIVVHGNCGQMAGGRMRRGMVAVAGSCGDVPGFGMRAGTVLVGGQCGVRPGADMVRGSVILLQEPPALLPTFRHNCAYTPPFWPMLLAWLHKLGLDLPHVSPHTVFERYSGDGNEGARGEVLVCRAE